MLKQRTIEHSVSCTGPMLHREGQCTMTLYPAPPDAGIVFRREDLPRKPRIPCLVDLADVFRGKGTVLTCGKASVMTVEHILAATQGLGIDNLIISLTGEGVPLLDNGSALPYVNLIYEAGLVIQEAPKRFLSVARPTLITAEMTDFRTAKPVSKPSYLLALPSEELHMVYLLEYANLPLGTQLVNFLISPRNFAAEIAPARSFLTTWEAQRYGPGGLEPLFSSVINQMPLVSECETFSERLPNEAARHKVLDMLGDLSVAGKPLRGTFIGIRSGHRLNIELACKLATTV